MGNTNPTSMQFLDQAGNVINDNQILFDTDDISSVTTNPVQITGVPSSPVNNTVHITGESSSISEIEECINILMKILMLIPRMIKTLHL